MEVNKASGKDDHISSSFMLSPVYIYIFIFFSSLHPGEMLLVRHLKAPSELIPLQCFWWFFFLTGSVCPGSFFHDKLCRSFFLHYGSWSSTKKHVWGRGANFNQFSLNLIPVCIWYICFCSLISSCMDSMGFEHQLLAPAARSCSKRRFRDEEEVPFKFVAAESRWTWQIWVPADPPAIVFFSKFMQRLNWWLKS